MSDRSQNIDVGGASETQSGRSESSAGRPVKVRIEDPSAQANHDCPPYFLADWENILAIHYAVDPQLLQKEIPFALDLFNKQAYVSIFAFQMTRARPYGTGPIGAAIFKPFASQPSLNVRTYVRHKGERGIFFMTEWMPNPIGAVVTRTMFGLPYRVGTVELGAVKPDGAFAAEIVDMLTQKSLRYRGLRELNPAYKTPAPESLEAFVMERYVTVTGEPSFARTLRVNHAPWQICRADVEIEEASLLQLTPHWHNRSEYIGACWSPAVRDISLDRPRIA
ncbi:MAG TPA: DUF2071 domain-containing protein [Phycisphaerae bacterium]|nr:DUF2071 domain-containing protein [Phycisphaerae bacterium]